MAVAIERKCDVCGTKDNLKRIGKGFTCVDHLDLEYVDVSTIDVKPTGFSLERKYGKTEGDRVFHNDAHSPMYVVK